MTEISRIVKFNDRVPKIVCLCGSTRFIETFESANIQETLKGHIVLSISSQTKTDAELFKGLSDEEVGDAKERLAELHNRKIDLADEVLVLNVGQYIGESTRKEIEYALSKNKVVRYWETV